MSINKVIDKYLSEAFADKEKTADIEFGRTFGVIARRMLSSFWEEKYSLVDAVKNTLKAQGLEEDEINEVRDAYTSALKRVLDRYNIRYRVDKKVFGVYVADLIDVFQPYYVMSKEKGISAAKNKEGKNMTEEQFKGEVEDTFKKLYDLRVKNRKYGKI